MKVAVLCEFSGTVRDAFIRREFQTLTTQQQAAWPTPNANDANRGPESKETKTARNSGGVNLIEAAGWQTPTSALGGSISRSGNRKGELLLGGQVRIGLPDQGNDSTTGRPQGSLNPEWVAQLMIGRGGELWVAGVKPV